MAIKDRVITAVERLRKANDEYYSLEFDTDSGQVLNPGASEAQLVDVERRLGAPLPPSYRAFLELHNGWLEFSGEAMVLPTDEHDKPWVVKRTKRFHDHIREFEKTNLLQHAFFVMMGEGEPNFAYFDKAKRSADGEMEVVYWDLVMGDLGRYPDFAAFLEAQATSMERLVAAKK